MIECEHLVLKYYDIANNTTFDKCSLCGLKMTETEQQSTSEEVQEEESKDEYDSDTDGDLFLYQFSRALDGVKEAIPKINFRRKHPQLGQKISNHEIRIRKLENTICNLKLFLKPWIISGMEKVIKKQFDKIKDQLVEDL